MTKVNGETNNSTSGLMNIVGMLSSSVELTLRKRFRDLAKPLEIVRPLHTKQYVIRIYYFLLKRLNQNSESIFAVGFGCD